MMRTSWEGMAAKPITPFSLTRCRADRPADLLDRHHPAQEVVPVQGEHGSRPAQRGLGEEVLELLVGADDPVHAVVVLDRLAGAQRGAPGGDLVLDLLAAQ